MNVSSHRIKVAVDLQRVFITSSVELLGLVVQSIQVFLFLSLLVKRIPVHWLPTLRDWFVGIGFGKFRSEGKLSFFGWVEIPFLTFSPLLHSFIGFLH